MAGFAADGRGQSWRALGDGCGKHYLNASGAGGYLQALPDTTHLLQHRDTIPTAASGSFVLEVELRLTDTHCGIAAGRGASSRAGPGADRGGAEAAAVIVLAATQASGPGCLQLLLLQVDARWERCSLHVAHLQRGKPLRAAVKLSSASLPRGSATSDGGGDDGDDDDGMSGGGDFRRLRLEVKRGNTLTLRCNGAVVMASVDVRRLLALAQQRATGLLATAQQSAAPVCGPLGLGVQHARLDFRQWAVTHIMQKQRHGHHHHSSSCSAPNSAAATPRDAMGCSSFNGGGAAGSEDGASAWHDRVYDSAYDGSGFDSGGSGADEAVAGDQRSGGAGRGGWAAQRQRHHAARQQLEQGPLRLPRNVAVAAAVSATTNKWTRKPYIQDLDPHLVEMVMSEIVRHDTKIRLSDVACRTDAKQLLSEAVVMPLMLPELFSGVLEPWRGVLLFGPPGTGKTMLARAVAATSGVTFFSVGAATLTSKWRGDSEKLVRALFAVAEHCAPSVVFVDEVDALVGCSRDAESEADGASRRFKSELLQQMDGLVSRAGAGRQLHGTAAGGVLVLAASNSPWDIDAALRRRLEKRIYIGLPDLDARRQLLRRYLEGVPLCDDVDTAGLAEQLRGYSGADIKLLCRDAVLQPVRRLAAGHSPEDYVRLRRSGVLGGGYGTRGAARQGAEQREQRAVSQSDLLAALAKIRPSVSAAQVARYEEWDRQFAAV